MKMIEYHIVYFVFIYLDIILYSCFQFKLFTDGLHKLIQLIVLHFKGIQRDLINANKNFKM